MAVAQVQVISDALASLDTKVVVLTNVAIVVGRPVGTAEHAEATYVGSVVSAMIEAANAFVCEEASAKHELTLPLFT